MKIALISPKGPLYRHRGGIFKRSLRYAPLTLTTLAALVPPELDAELTLIDEGIEDVDLDLEADLVGHDGHHRHGAARLRAGRALPRRAASRSCSAGRTSRSSPTTPSRTPTRSSSATPRTPGRSCCAISPRAACSRATTQQPGLSLAGRPFPRRDLLPARRFLTNNVFEATRGCVHNCDFCVVPHGLGAEAVPEAGRGGRRRHPAARRAQADLRRPEPHRRSRLRGAAVRGADPAARAVVRPRRRCCSPTIRRCSTLAARSGCRGLLMGFESISPRTCATPARASTRRSSIAEVVERCTRTASRCRAASSSGWTTTRRTSS